LLHTLEDGKLYSRRCEVRTLEVLEKVLRGKRIKADTKRHYRDALGSLAKYSEDWPEGGMVINEWLGSLSGYADATIRNWFNFVNSAGKYVKKAYKVNNPCESAERPRVEKKRRRYFTAGEVVRIIKACRFEQDKVLILTLIDSTCRIGELVGLKARNVRLAVGSFTVIVLIGVKSVLKLNVIRKLEIRR